MIPDQRRLGRVALAHLEMLAILQAGKMVEGTSLLANPAMVGETGPLLNPVPHPEETGRQ